jgi:hypothetical protein
MCIKCNKNKRTAGRRLCKYCINVSRCDLMQFLKALMSSAKSNLKHKKRAGCQQFNLTIEFMLAMWRKQRGRCAYTQLPMKHQPNSNWKCSLERLDNNKGYIEGNVVLICHELNTPSQWNKQKLELLTSTRCGIPPPGLDDQINEAKQGADYSHLAAPRRSAKQVVVDGATLHFCHYCQTFQQRCQFTKRISVGCKHCLSERNARWGCTLRSCLLLLCTSAKKHSRERQSKSTKYAENQTCEITFDDLMQIYERQQGLCFYSRMPMTFGPHKDWHMSLERLDVRRGYFPQNVVLVAAELNGPDNTRRRKYSNGGSGGMSQAKYAVLLRQLHNNNIASSVMRFLVPADHRCDDEPFCQPCLMYDSMLDL